MTQPNPPQFLMPTPQFLIFKPCFPILSQSHGEGRQTAMFSATFGTGVQNLAADFLDAYTFVAVGRVGSAAQTVQQRLLWVEDQLGRLGSQGDWEIYDFPNTDLNMGGIYMIL